VSLLPPKLYKGFEKILRQHKRLVRVLACAFLSERSGSIAGIDGGRVNGDCLWTYGKQHMNLRSSLRLFTGVRK